MQYTDSKSGDRKLIAIELELSLKTKARIKEIVNGYQFSPHYSDVFYFVASRDVELPLSKMFKKFLCNFDVIRVPRYISENYE